MKKNILIVFILLAITLCFISCKKDKPVEEKTPTFDKLVSAIYNSETILIGYKENISMKDSDMEIYIKETNLSLERKDQTKSEVTVSEKKLSTSGDRVYDETVSSYKTINDKKYVVIDGTEYETPFVIPTYYLTFVLSKDFLAEGYVLTEEGSNYTLKADVLSNKASSLFLNKSVGNITNVKIEIVVNNDKLISFKASYTSTNNFYVEINTTYNY